jgi:WD40 repeat protein
MKPKSIIFILLIGILLLNCKKKDEPAEVLPVQIISPLDNSIVHDSVPILFKCNSSLHIIKTEFYVDLNLSETFDSVPSKIFFNSNTFQKGTAHVVFLRITTEGGQTSNSNMVTLIIGKLTKPVVTVNFPGKTSLVLTWPDNSSGENGYRVSRKEGNGNITLVGDLGQNATTYTDNSIDTTKGYVYIVEVYSSDEKVASDSVKIAYFLNRYHSYVEYDVPDAIEGKVAISPDAQKVIATSYWGENFTVINTVTGIQTSLPQAGGSDGLAVDKNGDFFVTGNTENSNKIKIWDLHSLTLKYEYPTDHSEFELLTNNAGDQILVGGEPVQFLKVIDGSVVKTYSEYHTTCRSMKFSQDESLLLTGGNDDKVKLFNAVTGELVRTYTGHTGHVGTACFNFDESKVISGSYEDNTILVWDKNSGILLKTITRNSPTVTLRNGQNDQLIIASKNGLISVMDQNYQIIQEYRDFNMIYFADYNPSNDMIAAYGSQTKFCVKLMKKVGHWERI